MNETTLDGLDPTAEVRYCKKDCSETRRAVAMGPSSVHQIHISSAEQSTCKNLRRDHSKRPDPAAAESELLDIQEEVFSRRRRSRNGAACRARHPSVWARYMWFDPGLSNERKG